MHEPAFLNTAWTIQAIRGVLLCLVTVVIAWPVSQFYATPELLWIIPACGLSFISGGLQSTALYTSGRELKLGKITLMGLAETVIKTIITVVWALIWPSVWAIIGGSLISYVLFMIATHTMLPGIRNRFAWDREAAQHLTKFGRWVLASTGLTFLAMQSDRLILGKLVPMEVLGVYSIAYMFGKLPFDMISRLCSQVQFPALSEVFRHDPSRVEAKLLESRRLILAISQFGVIGIVLVSPWFFRLLYDVRYADASIMTPLLSGMMWFAILQASSAYALLSLGDARAVAISNGVNWAVTVMASIAGYQLGGVPGFIIGVGLGNCAGQLVVATALSRHHIRIFAQDSLFTVAVTAIAAFCVGLPAMAPSAFGTPFAQVGLGVVGLLISSFWLVWVGTPMLKEPLRQIISRARTRPRMISDIEALGSRRESSL